jgi:5-methylcytosine-specific restriction protein A
MPISPPSLCTNRCGTLVFGGGKCPECRLESRAESDARRPSSHDRGYNYEWKQTRAAYLAEHPMCECRACSDLPIWRRPEATDVDHIDGLGPKGPRGHDYSNLRALTHAHHSAKTARDDGGFGRSKKRDDS